MASPAIRPSRPEGHIDPRQEGDYPIILGESLKSEAKSNGSFLNVRYNWQPKSGFLDGRESKIRRSGDKWHLDISSDGRGEYQYVARAPSDQSGKSEDGTRSLALIFDESKSAFVLEAISATLDMNIRTGPGMPRERARDLPQLPKDLQSIKKDAQANGHAGTSSDDDTPDASNPYDFRHFLAEARENIEKANHMPGNRTPLPGSRTPMSGISTPVPGGSRFQPTTPQVRAAQAKAPSKPVEPQKKKKNEAASKPVKPPTKAPAKRETPKTSQALSKARISDSDDSDNDTISVRQAPTSRPTASKPPKPPVGKGHARNFSANIGSSPHIIINDDDGDLEIDMGSPPPEDERNRRRGRVDPEAFRSHTGTPIGGLSSNFASRSTSRPVSRPAVVEDPKRGRGKERDSDVKMKDIEAGSEDDEDDDVEEFELGSPRETTKVLPTRGDVSRDEEKSSDEEEDDRGRGRRPQQPQPQPQQQQFENAAPTPPAPVNAYEDDDEDLEAALEAALEEESENQNSGVGLGIGMASHNAQDDESEVSEEE